jgi:hypothetical protein
MHQGAAKENEFQISTKLYAHHEKTCQSRNNIMTN